MVRKGRKFLSNLFHVDVERDVGFPRWLFPVRARIVGAIFLITIFFIIIAMDAIVVYIEFAISVQPPLLPSPAPCFSVS